MNHISCGTKDTVVNDIMTCCTVYNEDTEPFKLCHMDNVSDMISRTYVVGYDRSISIYAKYHNVTEYYKQVLDSTYTPIILDEDGVYLLGSHLTIYYHTDNINHIYNILHMYYDHPLQPLSYDIVMVKPHEIPIIDIGYRYVLNSETIHTLVLQILDLTTGKIPNQYLYLASTLITTIPAPISDEIQKVYGVWIDSFPLIHTIDTSKVRAYIVSHIEYM